MRISFSGLIDHMARRSTTTLHQGSEAVGDSVDGVSTDSRSVGGRDLFVPLVADRDGHEFIDSALKAGAAATLTGKADGAEIVARHPAATVIEVTDTAEALLGIGRFARHQLTPPVIGITGSVGKTSAKDLARAACGAAARTWASERSFNNEIGVPLTLANAPDDTEITVVEMGARGVGHIAQLCEIARPTIAVVTEVALAHSELFGSVETIAQAKGELVEAVPADGFAILNADNPWVAAMADRCAGGVLTFGTSPQADFTVSELELTHDLRARFTLVAQGERYPVVLSVAGAHMANNAAAAVAAAVAAGVDLEVAVEGVASGTLSPHRMEVTTAPSGLVVIDDAYNANPTSMRAALRALEALAADTKVAVIGLMAELGDEGDEEHRAVADEMVAAGVEVIAVAAPQYGPDVTHVRSVGEAEAYLGAVGSGTAVLVKGSRVAELERLVASLVDPAGS